MPPRPFGLVFVVFSLLLGVTCGRVAVAGPDDVPLYSLTEENDGIVSHQDRHYTQGLMFARTASPDADGFWDGLTQSFDQMTRLLGAGPMAARHYRWPIIGQSLFTPTDIETSAPRPDDRPYAGWLYFGAGLRRRSNSGRLDQFQLLFGVVGPWALGEEVQEGFHKITGYRHANGWNNQLHNEPGLVVTYQTTWDWPLLHLGRIESDLLPETGISVGNVLTYGDIGVTLRLGHGLAAGGTPQTVVPGLSGSRWFDPSELDGAFGWMLFGGIQTRAVWRDLFLQGNSFRDSPSVEKRDFVTDEDVGLSLLFRFGLRVDLMYIKRSREFVGQVGDDRFGSVTLSMPFL